MCNSSGRIVRVDVDLDDEGSLVERNLADGEFIEMELVEASRLHDKLLEESKKGHLIDAKLYTYAYALKMSNSLMDWR